MNQSFFDLRQLEVSLGQPPCSESYTSSNPPCIWNACVVDDRCPNVLPLVRMESSVCNSNSYIINPAAATKATEEMDLLVPNAPKRNYDAMNHNQEHVMAERKRREMLSERFTALSALLPGLKKVDKASVLDDGIKYLKQLQKKIKALEAQVSQRSVVSAVLFKKTQLCSDGDYGSSCNESMDGGQCGESLPQIEARVCQRTILINIHCENRSGMLVRAVSEIEKLHLSVVSMSALPFAAAALDITVMTQIEEQFSMTAKELVNKLSSAIRQFSLSF